MKDSNNASVENELIESISRVSLEYAILFKNDRVNSKDFLPIIASVINFWSRQFNSPDITTPFFIVTGDGNGNGIKELFDVDKTRTIWKKLSDDGTMEKI